jgi:hypothetical protein
VRTKYPSKCARRSSDLADWARSVIADPSAHDATEREASLVADLLTELEAAR